MESEEELSPIFNHIKIDGQYGKFFRGSELQSIRRQQYEQLMIEKKYDEEKILQINFQVSNCTICGRWRAMNLYLGCLLSSAPTDPSFCCQLSLLRKETSRKSLFCAISLQMYIHYIYIYIYIYMSRVTTRISHLNHVY